MLKLKDFCKAIEMIPLVSVDLLFIYEGQILLGPRKNRPAKDYLFTPGGRIHKYERQQQAIARIAQQETNLEIDPIRAMYIGVFDHVYNDNYFNDNFGTHYVSHGYIIDLRLDEVNMVTTDDQHVNFMWYEIESAKLNPLVHPYVKLFLAALPSLKHKEENIDNINTLTL